MSLTLPENMESLIYFSRRRINDRLVICWVDKEICSECNKGLMEKPRDPKTGKPKIRAQEYMCNNCGHSEEKKTHETKLVAHAKYTCPHCDKEGDASAPYKRKTIQGVSTLRLQCEHCGGNIDITKKMKEPKKKKAKK
jgi:transcription elongation factor Elf1